MNQALATGWYPAPAVTQTVDTAETSTADTNAAIMPSVNPSDDTERLSEAHTHAVFQDLQLKYLTANAWHGVSKEVKEGARRHHIHGVQVRKLPSNHFLHGEYGLFAARKFAKFDIIGEYVGKIVGDKAYGHYVAALEDKEHEKSLGIDAEHFGNEMRFINSYLNVDFKANVSMRTAYVGTYPHILIVCLEDIDVGDELLLDYGEAYNQAYLTKKTIKIDSDLDYETVKGSLPFFGSSSSSLDDGNDKSLKKEET